MAVNAGARKSLNLNPGGPSRSSSIAPAETILRRARFFGTHAPRDQENQPEKCRRESTPESRCCFGATPLVAELPRSNGQTTAWPSAPSRAKGCLLYTSDAADDKRGVYSRG